ncbi:hypothetical protein [Vreelandella neptunia]|uniref:Uncharacterized protein n=1 Tax=Vreelandella neptunia TaxID=115551 RepID=A0ABZ0YR75_9GAMM|nr:hypothetical protein [Halomonas neptunia]MDN3561518.1 hypothetical protein [Halomonas neptunia]TDV99548.1 hypothetical protein BDK62_102523 [Halomonas alkaliantarctica]WQH14668.1 hypothetical protein SR894_09045 [Halomonas neptunia]
MNNKLMPVIIDNPCQKSWGYRSRDTLITLVTLVLWALVMSRMYLFFIVEEAILEQLVGSVMIKLVLVGFLVTFLTFHCWAVYNKYLYTSYLKRQLRHFQQPTLKLDNETDSEMDDEHSTHEQAINAPPSQATN